MSLSDSFSPDSSDIEFDDAMTNALQLAERFRQAARQEKSRKAVSDDSPATSSSHRNHEAALPESSTSIDTADNVAPYTVSEGLMNHLLGNIQDLPEEFEGELQLWASDAWNQLIDPPDELESGMFVACCKFIPCNSVRVMKMASAANNLQMARCCKMTDSHDETIGRWKALAEDVRSPNMMAGVIASVGLNLSHTVGSACALMRSSIAASKVPDTGTGSQKCGQPKTLVECDVIMKFADD
jgi:hypothetical protein